MTDTTSDDDYKKVVGGSDKSKESGETSKKPEDEIKIRSNRVSPEKDTKPKKRYVPYHDELETTYDPYQVAVAILNERIVYYDEKEDDVYYYKDGIYTEATPLIRGFAVRLMEKDYHPSVLNSIRDILKELSQDVIDNPIFEKNGIPKVVKFIEPPPHWVLFKDCIYDMLNKEFIEQKPDYVFRDGQRINFNLKGIVTDEFQKIVKKEKGGILNKEQYNLFFEMVGYSFYRAYTTPGFLVIAGDGGNGKSTLFEILISLFGDSMEMQPFTALLNPERRVNLHNKFCNAVSETPPDKLMVTDDFKALTSGDKIMTRRLYHTEILNERFFTKYFFFGNSVPEVSDSSYGFSRRIYFIELLDKVSGIEKDEIISMLKKEEVKRWLFFEAVKGYNRFVENSFTRIDGEENGSKRYRMVSNPEHYFLSHAIEAGEEDGYEIEKGILYTRYETFCKLKNIKPKSKIRFYSIVRIFFGDDVTEIQNQTGKHKRLFSGIRLKDNWETTV
jgi:putative DNA primase/helicase